MTKHGRTPLAERVLPDYTRGEELVNTVSHAAGGVFALAALALCVASAAARRNIWGIVCGAVYGATMLAVYTISSVYHGLPIGLPKQVMRVVDHCAIYFLIAGTYTPIVLGPLRAAHPAAAWGLFGMVWLLCALGVVPTAIDLKRYRVFSMVCYVAMGWCVVAFLPVLRGTVPLPAVLWLLAGGIAFTVGAVLYGVGKKKRYMHSVFHLFVVLGTVLQFVCILGYVM
ncbi:MAG: hemolysin III family protein [Oscillospiraceae bacterium]|jgi:hemolysin III|nr:hemolysin III family protein [Oscillospiraceae bacterium]